MFDSALAFTRYRLEVVKSWPNGQEKFALLAAIESSLRRLEAERDGRKDPNSLMVEMPLRRSSHNIAGGRDTSGELVR